MDSKTRRRPGRPRKTPVKKQLKRSGISNAPINVENCMEMVYDTPVMFKRIFTLFKAMAVQHICIEFREKTVNILTPDHLKKSYAKINVNCENLNHYYCMEPINSYINPKNLEKIIKVIDNDYTSMTFLLKTISNRSSLHIIFKNSMHIDEYREIELIKPSDNIYDVSFDDLKYPVKFTLPSKYFKKIITDISTFSDSFTITKVGLSPLAITYISKDKTVCARHIVQDSKAISLLANITEDDIFSSSVNIDYIKPLSNSLLSDFISISADNRNNMIFKLAVDRNSDGRPTINIYVNTKCLTLKIYFLHTPHNTTQFHLDT